MYVAETCNKTFSKSIFTHIIYEKFRLNGLRHLHRVFIHRLACIVNKKKVFHLTPNEKKAGKMDVMSWYDWPFFQYYQTTKFPFSASVSSGNHKLGASGNQSMNLSTCANAISVTVRYLHFTAKLTLLHTNFIDRKRFTVRLLKSWKKNDR